MSHYDNRVPDVQCPFTVPHSHQSFARPLAHCIMVGLIVLVHTAAALAQETTVNDRALVVAATGRNAANVTAALDKGGNPNALVEGKTAFMVADWRDKVTEQPSEKQNAVLGQLLRASLASIAAPPSLQDIRTGIADAVRSKFRADSVVARIVRVYPDSTYDGAVRVQCDAVAYGDSAGYLVISASGQGYRAPDGMNTWVVLPESAGLDVQLKRDSMGQWTGSIVQGLNFARAQALKELEATPDAFKTDIGGGFPALLAAILVADEDVALKLLAASDGATKPGALPFPPLFFAAGQGCERVVKSLLEAGVEADRSGPGDATPLNMAAQSGHTAIAQALLNSGASVDKPKRGGITPLMIAAANGHKDVLALLLKSGVSVDQTSGSGKTALGYAASKGSTACGELLIAADASVNAPSSEGWTPLHCAAAYGHEGFVQLLLTHKADQSKKTDKGFTALQMASDNEHTAVVELLGETE